MEGTVIEGTPPGVPSGELARAWETLARECESFPDYCKRWRRLMGYTQTEVSRRGRISRGTVAHFEAGDVRGSRCRSTSALVSGYTLLGMPLPIELYSKWVVM